ncbi:hypothetical protein QW131_25305 [Roseibium salinum]|nr:hypothetical protein [Roseibium salinum]
MLANEDVLILKFWFVLPRQAQEERLKEIETKKNAARHVLADWAALKKTTRRPAKPENGSSRRPARAMRPGSSFPRRIPNTATPRLPRRWPAP